MARQSVLNNSPKAAGDYPFGPLAIPDALSLVTFDFDVTNSLSGDDVAWTAEFSFDGGATWPAQTRGGFLGGTPTRKDGSAIPASLISTETVRLPNGTSRLVRGTVTITGTTRKIPVGVDLL